MTSSATAVAPVRPTPSSDLSRGAQSRRELILAAIEVFAESGVEGATTREIARRANQNIAAISYYFGGKDGLYLAVAEHIVQVVLQRLGPLLDEIESFLRMERSAPNEAMSLMKRLLGGAITSNKDIVGVTRIIVREQTRPTAAFAILYGGVLERVQKLGAELISRYVGGEPTHHELVVRFHALLGESMAFRFARETILHRAGWSDIGRAEEGQVRVIVEEHAELILRGLRAKRQRGGRST
jgi:TetR/AcrR family transcriptional regulator, regulator of cefoperazone and chloramphenicol sensitivity